jgi:membrane-associated protease RseP (regulator of RpoE activity)
MSWAIFAVAKLAGIRVYEFAIGFGPALGSIT